MNSGALTMLSKHHRGKELLLNSHRVGDDKNESEKCELYDDKKRLGRVFVGYMYGGENQIWVHRVEVVPFRFDDSNSSRSDVVPLGTIYRPETTLVYC